MVINVSRAAEINLFTDRCADIAHNTRLLQHLDRLFVTNDAATILRELEVVHPAAKVLVMASQQQEAEVRVQMAAPNWNSNLMCSCLYQMGDRTNFVLMFAGELLKKAEALLTMGLHPSEIIAGYELARDKAEEELKSKDNGIHCFYLAS